MGLRAAPKSLKRSRISYLNQQLEQFNEPTSRPTTSPKQKTPTSPKFPTSTSTETNFQQIARSSFVSVRTASQPKATLSPRRCMPLSQAHMQLQHTRQQPRANSKMRKRQSWLNLNAAAFCMLRKVRIERSLELVGLRRRSRESNSTQVVSFSSLANPRFRQ